MSIGRETTTSEERGERMKVCLTRILALGAMAMACCASAPGPVSAQEIIRVGYIPVADCLQLYVAEDQGFFKDAGLAIDSRPMEGGAIIAPSVESGEIDVGWSNSVTIIIAHSKGFDFGFLTAGAFEQGDGHRTHSLLVAKDSPIKSFADLVGKKVAINTLGNINELSLMEHAERAGVDIKKIDIVEIPFPHMEAALKNGSVDAIIGIEPFVTLSIAHGTARYLDKPVHRVFGDNFMIGSWFAKKSWVEKNASKAAAFSAAIDKASDYIAANPGKLVESLVKHTKLTADLIEKISLPAFPSHLEPTALQCLIDLSAKHNYIDKSFNADDIVFKMGNQQPADK